MADGIPDHPLRQWRKSKNMTLAVAAAGVGTVRQVWSDWERGRRRPNSVYMPRLREFTRGAITADHFYSAEAEPALKAA